MGPGVPPIGAQAIAKPVSVQDKKLSLATLDGRVARLLLAMSEDSDSRPIAAIWPKRHKVIIDINLIFKPRDGILKANPGAHRDTHGDRYASDGQRFDRPLH